MTIIYCDLCGKSLDKGDTGNRIRISEFKAEACDTCAKQLINYIKSGPNKSGVENVHRS